MIKVADLEAKIREQAGELEILKLQVAGYKDDIATLTKERDELAQAVAAPVEKKSGRQRNA